jgi:hypothetical protein
MRVANSPNKEYTFHYLSQGKQERNSGVAGGETKLPGFIQHQMFFSVVGFVDTQKRRVK